MKKTFSLIITTLTMFSLQVGLAFAENNPLTMSRPPIIPGGTESAPLKLPGVGSDTGQALQQNVIPSITNTVIGLTGGVALLFVIISGIQILTAYGNEEKVGTAKKTLTWALAGLVLAMLSYAIVQIIISIQFGVKTS